MRRLPLLLLATLLLAVSSSVQAQIVRGLLVDRESGQPVEGAMVWLVEGDARRAGALSDSSGRFFVRAPAPGRYVARAERIGYATFVSDTIDIPSSGTVELRLEVSAHALELDVLEVEGTGRCDVRPREGLETARLWEEVRKALEAAQWANDREMYHYEVERYERKLTPALRLLEEKRHARRIVARDPVRSVPVEQLTSLGYIQGDNEKGYTYYGPDPRVLLSDEFLDTHCFRVRRGNGDQQGLVGLAFEPVRALDRSDITGVLWVDGRTGALRFVEYRYTRLPYDVRSRHLGGRLDLERLPNGAWIVKSWYIRMPRVSIPRADYSGPPTLYAIHEAGGVVVTMRPSRARAPLSR